MKEALLYAAFRPEEHGGESGRTVRCGLCAHRCVIKDGARGLCRVRENRNGRLVSLVYGRIVSENIDPVEKKPLFHFLPGTLTYSICTVGCNFRCAHCQNYQISQVERNAADIFGKERTAQDIVAAARKSGCQSISYTYVEPTVFFEFALETAILAKESGLRNIFVTNGFFTAEAGRMLAPVIDAVNIDLKAFTDDFYRNICGARLEPVLDSIRLMKELGVWVEVTTLVIPGLNDSAGELSEIAAFLADIDPDIPWHVSRFHPTYRMADREPTPAATLMMAREKGIARGLRYVYIGNLAGFDGEDTLCPFCQKKVILRQGYRIVDRHLEPGSLPQTMRCSFCRAPIPGVFV